MRIIIKIDVPDRVTDSIIRNCKGKPNTENWITAVVKSALGLPDATVKSMIGEPAGRPPKPKKK